MSLVHVSLNRPPDNMGWRTVQIGNTNTSQSAENLVMRAIPRSNPAVTARVQMGPSSQRAKAKLAINMELVAGKSVVTIPAWVMMFGEKQ
jgi:hypothetical protein